MYLKELRIHGFKSFADQTRLELRRGVTAIVGPNGCGKSNIADAIRWVLGEQSAKSLRAGAMQDVIFQGTASRKPVNLCEVSLIFAECEERLGAAYHEVEITRRVVREGGSDYYLNGKSCRLKDIQRLFLDTGIGQVSYSFMLQGQIDQVLSSNPGERRAIFEEAAGISRYKAQRREALAKLTQVDANLARVTDVMEEVARQTASLKRQAAKAMRYQRIHHRLVHLDRAYMAWQFGELDEECRSQRRKTDLLAGEMQKLAGELEAMDRDLASHRDAVGQIRARMDSAQHKVYQLRSEKESAANRAEMAASRSDDLRQRQQRLQEELQLLAEEEDAITDKLAGETKLKQEQLDLFGSSDEDFQKRSTELTELQKQVGHAESQHARNRQALLVKEGAVSRLRSNVTGLELDLKTYQVRHANIAEEIHRYEEQLAIAVQDRDAVENARQQRSAQRDQKLQLLTELKEQMAQRTSQFRALQQQIQERERERASAQAKINVLKDLQAKLEGFSDGAKALLQGKLETVVDRAALRVFLEQVRVDDSAATAVELLLGNVMDSVVVAEPDLLPIISGQLRERKLGRASMVVASARKAPPKAEAPKGWRAVRECIHSSADDISRFLDHHLAGCYLVEDLETLLATCKDQPDWQFRRAVTEQGELVDGGEVYLLGGGSGKRSNSFLSRQNQLKALGREVDELESTLERARMEAAQVQAKLEGDQKRIDEQQALAQELQQELATLAAQREAAERSMRQQQTAAEERRAELAKLETGSEQSAVRLSTAQNELKELEAGIAEVKELIRSGESSLEQFRVQRETLREQFNEARFEISRKRQRLELLDRGLDELKRKAQENAKGREQRDREIHTIHQQLEELAAQQKQQLQLSGDIGLALQRETAALDADRELLKQAEQRLAVLNQGITPKREAHNRYAAEHNKAEVQYAKLEARLQFLVEACLKSHECQPRDIDWRAQVWFAGDAVPERIRVDIEEETPEELDSALVRPEPTDVDLQQMQASVVWQDIADEITSLQQREQAIGPVNLAAIDEYKALKQRHDFLSAQSSDLWNAKEALLKAIDEINRTSQEMFAETFASIRKNFHFTFDKLFGGGRADLQLVDDGDVLESGIDITAQPPGTRLSSIGLLSGGQKTMTAVALLFAIYMVKPSPFCVLDEIDAPLDDANIGRFTDMLEGFLEFSQFLIITHNKRTIRVADTIYGATMQEKGVTRMVSMRFNRNTGNAEIAQ